ncbi:MAG TPA: TetR family transcriptional regulator [Trebonia sp.]
MTNPASGLRERKKARTRASLREHALRLFREQGYAATTVEQIAAAAEVSPSTFFRYFPTKEDVVLQDDMDTRMLEALDRQPPEMHPIAAIRAASKDALASFSPEELETMRVSTELTLTVPEVRARAMDEFARTIDLMGEAIARRAGRSGRDMNARVLAGAVIGVVMSVTMPWSQFAVGEGDVRDMFDRIDKGLALLESGLPL